MQDAEEGAVTHSLWNQPEGRKSKHRTLRLLYTGEPLYVPVTQVTRDAVQLCLLSTPPWSKPKERGLVASRNL